MPEPYLSSMRYTTWPELGMCTESVTTTCKYCKSTGIRGISCSSRSIFILSKAAENSPSCNSATILAGRSSFSGGDTRGDSCLPRHRCASCERIGCGDIGVFVSENDESCLRGRNQRGCCWWSVDADATEPGAVVAASLGTADIFTGCALDSSGGCRPGAANATSVS